MDGLRIVSVAHEAGTTRADARERIRLALRGMVAAELRVDVERVALQCEPGSAPGLLVDGKPAPGGLSIAHDGLLSLAAYHAHGPVGIDVMQVQDTPDWYDVARHYLGPNALATLAATPQAARAAAFAQAWTAREACLKCLGLALSEWTELPEGFLMRTLAIAPGYACTAAIRTPAGRV